MPKLKLEPAATAYLAELYGAAAVAKQMFDVAITAALRGVGHSPRAISRFDPATGEVEYEPHDTP